MKVTMRGGIAGTQWARVTGKDLRKSFGEIRRMCSGGYFSKHLKNGC
jgi:hypothetical protein